MFSVELSPTEHLTLLRPQNRPISCSGESSIIGFQAFKTVKCSVGRNAATFANNDYSDSIQDPGQSKENVYLVALLGSVCEKLGLADGVIVRGSSRRTLNILQDIRSMNDG